MPVTESVFNSVCLFDSLDFQNLLAKSGHSVSVGNKHSEVAGEHLVLSLDIKLADVDVKSCRNHSCQLENSVAVNALDADIGEEGSGHLVPACGEDARAEACASAPALWGRSANEPLRPPHR